MLQSNPKYEASIPAENEFIEEYCDIGNCLIGDNKDDPAYDIFNFCNLTAAQQFMPLIMN